MMLNDTAVLGSLAVCIITAGSGYASQRAASKASASNTTTTSRVEMEKEAYERARSYDTETIRRQDDEIEALRVENRQLHAEIDGVRQQNRELNDEVNTLRSRIARLEQLLPPEPH